MNTSWRDALTTALAALGGVVVFAKLESYSWWLIGSWKGALGTIAVIGLAILLVNAAELLKLASTAVFAEMALWIAAATVVIVGLFTETTKAQFVGSAIVIGVAWLAQVVQHLWNSTGGESGHHLSPAH